jgi:hypothetical protein
MDAAAAALSVSKDITAAKFESKTVLFAFSPALPFPYSGDIS